MANRLAGDLRKGDTFELDNTVQVVVDFQHVKPGKGAAFVRVKMRNVMTGSVLERTFNPSEKFELAYIERKKMSYSYSDGDLYYFMDNETYDLIPMNHDLVEDALHFIKEGSIVDVAFYKGNPFSVEPENFVVLQVAQCEPGIPGATAQPGSKAATLETGYVIQVPLFIEEGEMIRVDTRTGEYMSRA
ncbi:MAG: elongation factor P [Firmicutes bacterium]|uniref:Elongation factor P n=1 Tax=Candidatus Stercoripulliclostridium pullicola TaxID=2840953 RepID=A0A940DI94_9FIRM|nr:elongation factor P [Candidatus Stercoripulliclostridium pullicola]